MHPQVVTSLSYTTLCAPQVCDDCLRTDHPEKCASFNQPQRRGRSHARAPNAQVPPQAGQHAALAQFGQGRDRARAPRRCVPSLPIHCARLSRALALHRGPCYAVKREPRHLGRRFGKGLWHGGDRKHDQARAQQALLQHPRAVDQRQPRLRRVRPVGRRRVGLLGRVARAGGERLLAGARAHTHPLTPHSPPAPCPRATCS